MSLGLANFTYDSITGIFAFDATIQNDLGQVMGSPDGTTTTGIKIFFYSGPTCTGGSCYVSNADGTGTFTASNQPYFEYNQMLAPQAVSASKNWQIYVDPAVESFNFEIEAYAAFPAEYSVNQTPPDTLPIAYHADTNITSNAAPIAGQLLKNVVAVDFQSSAQLADRQLAIAKIGGTLIGGDQIDADSDGIYYVGVPSDSVASGVFAATDTLMGLTAVADASPEIMLPNPLGYVRPRDDSTSGWATWQLNPDSARGGNWGPEAVAAPLAWGCSTGDTSVLVGIADHGWHDVADTRGNVVSSEALNVFTDTTHDRGHSHGQWVNSILAATGDNGAGIAGMVWTAKVARTETALRNTAGVPTLDSTGAPRYSLSSIMGATERAIKRGAKIVNLSYWAIWPPGHVLTAREVAFTDTTGAIFTRRLKRLAAAPLNLQPLIVLIAGNAAIDASTAGFPQAAADPALKPRIIVVAASYQSTNHSEAQTGVSNTGSLVDVAAPGNRVEALNEFGRVDSTLFGTSLAAPVVAGIAAQLAAFDHSLSASDIKTLIVNGAINGGRTWGTVPIVNAYESLKLAAQRRGAPLCGNVVYPASDSAIVIERQGSTVTDTIVRGDPSYVIEALHGGKKLYLVDSTGAVNSVSWTALNTWTAPSLDSVSYDALHGYQLSSFNLANGLNHDGDSAVFSRANVGPSNQTIYIAPPLDNNVSDWKALYTLQQGDTTSNPSLAFSATSQTIYMLISNAEAGSAAIRCRLYTLPSSGGTPQALGSPIENCRNLVGPGPNVAPLASSEDGTSLQLWAEDSTTTMYTMYVINAATGAVLHQVTTPAAMLGPIFAPDAVARRPHGIYPLPVRVQAVGRSRAAHSR